MIDLDGHVRVVQRCVAGPVYCDADRQAMTVYLAVQLPTHVDVSALDRALADLQERFDCIRQLVVEVGGAYYYAQTDEPLRVEVADDAGDDAADDGQAWAERLSEPVPNSDAGLPGVMRGLRVLTGSKTIVVAMNHALMDGGALLALTTELLESYAGYSAGARRSASPNRAPTLSETTFEALELPVGSDWTPVAGYGNGAFVPPADMDRLDELVELTVPTASVLSLCKRLGGSPATFFTSLIAHAIRESHPRDPRRHLIASIAIDYRTLLGCENTIRNASWTAAFDLDDAACKEMGWQEQAKWLRTEIGKRRDVRYAKGWIKTERAINVMSSRLQKKRLHNMEQTAAQQSFMLTYLRIPDSPAFEDAKVCFAGFSLPSDMTLVEYAGSFHLFLIPLQRQDAFLAALDEAAVEVGLSFATDRLRKPSVHFEVSALQASGPCVFFACDPTSQDMEALAAEMRSYVERGYRVRAYTSSRLASLVEEAGAACISCDPIFVGTAGSAAWADELEDMLRQDVRVFEPECMVASESCAWASPLADKLGLRLENHPRARLWSELWDTDSYDDSLTLQDLAWATLRASGTAIVCGGRRMSYADFHRTTTRIACALIERGLKATDVVAIHMRRDERLLCAMFGIIKAGAAYLVLNTDWPQQRLRYVVENSDARYVIANEVPQDSRVSAETISYQWLVEKPVPGVAGPQGVLRARMLRPHSSDVAALYYTSGSTGKPKGVVLSHRNMVDSTLPLRGNACIREGSIRCRSILDVVNAGFMASVLTYGPSLYTGGTHVFVQSEELEQIAPVARIMKQEEVDFVLMTPSVMTTLLTDEGFSQSLSQVREITLCGESFSQQLADTLTDLTREGTIINNLYGTTEAAVGLACVDVRGREVTMGVPFAHTEVFAENEQGERLPHGQVGQLCVKGARVALGYHKLPELSAEKFFVDADGIRVYRTGDNGFVNQRGEIEFLGRDDRMVKLGGVRFELPEVEYHLLQLPYIREAAVKVCEVDDRDQLCAVYVGDESDTVRAGRRIRADLASVVPQAMIPSVYVHVRAMPVTERGKIDYSCLPIPTSVQVQDSTLPANETEQTICEAFAEVFGVASVVGAEASFFELGGNSLRGITLLAALLKRGQSVSMKELLDHPTPRALASLLLARQETATEDAQTTNDGQEAIELPDELHELMASEAVEAILPASNVMTAYLFMGQLGVTDRSNRIRVRLTLEGALEEAEFRCRVDALVRNHPSLRSNFVKDGQGKYWQVVRSRQDVPIYHKDLRRLSDAAQTRLLSGFWQVMDESGQPFEVACFPVSAGRSIVLFEVEHTHADGMSLLVMANELASGASLSLPVDGFIDYRRRHVQASQHIPLPFREYLTPERAPLKSPEATLGEEVSRTAEVVELSRSQTDELVRRCGREGVTPFALVQLSYGRALLSLLNEDEVWVLHTDGGRSSSHDEEGRIVGNLFCGVPLSIRTTTTAAQLQEDMLAIADMTGISDSDLLRGATWLGIYEGVVSEDFGEREPALLSFNILQDANRGGNQMTMADGRLRISLRHADEPKRNLWYRQLAELLRTELLG